jgi:hypothetical protein
MILTPDDIERRVEASSLIMAIDTIKNGHIRIQTTFQYPETSYIDVYIKQNPQPLLPSLDAQKITLTDFGGSLMFLLDYQINPFRSPSNRKRMEHIKESYGVVFREGAIECDVSLDSLIEGIIRLAQACLIFTGLMFTKRLSLSTDFSQKVEDIIADCEIEYETDGKILTRTGNVIVVDFLTKGNRTQSGIMALSSSNEHYAHQRANEIFARWDDILTLSDWDGQKITIVDEKSNIREDDLNRIERKSQLVFASDTRTFSDLLKAG